MQDIIQLLPDAISNQIAAGEVIQRPSSLVKELLENSIDAGSDYIRLVIKDAGKALVQVIDNGKGMTETDARLCFEKHATSKIKDINDLFSIKTMGFRGEALASIAAVAQVNLKTRTPDNELGTTIDIEASEVKKQEAVSTPQGTIISVKNLFYNIPARRNFLKSNAVETRHIVEEFIRIALAHPGVSFVLENNDFEMYHLKSGNLRQRIVALFGDKINNQLVPVEEESEKLHVYGFVGKPEAAKKTRGEQFIFINNRFIKSAYLNHAINRAYEDILPKETYPFYALFIDIDTNLIDINVHPSKQEIKFEDERLVYTFINAGIRHSLGRYSITPSLDFNQDVDTNNWEAFSSLPSSKPVVENHADKIFVVKPDKTDKFQQRKEWQELYQIMQSDVDVSDEENSPLIEKEPQEIYNPVQIHQRYIITQIKSGFVVIDQQAAHQRILFEEYMSKLKTQHNSKQIQLFPKSMEFNPADAAVLTELLADINALGFDLQPFGNNAFVLHATPADLENVNENNLIEEFMEQYKNHQQLTGLSKRERLASSLAASASIKSGKKLSAKEMASLIDRLFACENPYAAPNGNKTFVSFDNDSLEKSFKN